MEELEMFCDDIPRDWVGKVVGCHIKDSDFGSHVGELLKIGSESLLSWRTRSPAYTTQPFCRELF
jgi:hypothetical protein